MVPGLGAAILGGLGSLSVYREFFIAVAVLALALTFYRHFKRRIRLAWAGGFSAMLSEFRPRTVSDAHLYLGALVVAALIMLPPWTVTHYFNPPNPCSIRNPWPRDVLREMRKAPRNPCAVSSPQPAVNPFAI